MLLLLYNIKYDYIYANESYLCKYYFDDIFMHFFDAWFGLWILLGKQIIIFMHITYKYVRFIYIPTYAYV